MAATAFRAPTDHGHLGGWVDGDGPPVLLVHGGPGLSFEYLEQPARELLAHFRVASFQQRGLAPSSTDGPFTIDQAVVDVVAVLDHLDWQRAYLLGHSWGGHLVLHVAVKHPERLLGVLSVDPIGAVGDGGNDSFGQELLARVPEDRQEQLAALSRTADDSPEAALEHLRCLWPGYFADRDHAAPFPPMRLCPEAGQGLWPDMMALMPSLAAALAGVSVPVGFLMGADSPMRPAEAGIPTAALIPHAWTTVLPATGHFPWFEHPGSLLTAMQRLASS